MCRYGKLPGQVEVGSRESGSVVGSAGSSRWNFELAAGGSMVLESVAAEVDRVGLQETGLVAVLGVVEGMNHPCSCTGGIPGLRLAGWGLMMGLDQFGSFECCQNGTIDMMEQGCAAGAGEPDPTSIALVGEGSWACY